MAVLDDVRAGCSLADLSQEFRSRAASRGADFDHFSIGAFGLGYVTHAAYELPDEPGVLPRLRVHNSLGWFSDSGLTVCIGECDAATTADTKPCAIALLRGQGWSARALKPRRSRKPWCRSSRSGEYPNHFHMATASAWKFADHPVLMPTNGKVIRDDCVELSADLSLEQGMVVNLQAPVLTPGVRSVHCEQTFVITADGCRPLVCQDRQQPVLGT